MLKTWIRICEANVNHYNNHPTQHNLLTAAALVGAVAVTRVTLRKIATEDYSIRSGYTS